MEGCGCLRRQAYLLAAVSLILFDACAGHPPAQPPVAAPAPAPPPVAAPPRAAVPPGERAYAMGRAALANANHEQALKFFAAAWKEKPGHPAVTRDFPAALEGLKRTGDDALRQGRPEEAGTRWEAALRYLSHPAAKGKSLSFTKVDLQKQIDKVSASLMEKGLVEYRKGDLDAAIAVWRSILAYDPSHEEAARWIRTASTQLENLKKIAPMK